MFRFLITVFFLCPFLMIGQDSSTVKQKLSSRKWDTTKYQKFDYVFILSYYQQYRNFEHDFVQTINSDTLSFSNQTYVAESPLNSGLSFCFDKFQLSLGIGSSPRSLSEGKGSTKVFNLGFNIGDNNYIVENYFRRFTGFYNSKTPSFDTTFKSTGDYYQQPGMRTDLLMSRFMYFTNSRKFSFKSGFGCNYRQLRSAATWILGGSINGFHLKNDSAIFPSKVKYLFNDYAGLKDFRSYNFSLNAGAAATIVLFKAWFITAYFTLGPEQQWRQYNLGGVTRKLSYVSVSGTGRISLGLNLKRFYMLGYFSNDYNLFNSSGLDYTTSSITGNFSFGWRFNTGNPKFYQKFQETRLYKAL